jgi:hypothetical protein
MKYGWTWKRPQVVLNQLKFLNKIDSAYFYVIIMKTSPTLSQVVLGRLIWTDKLLKAQVFVVWTKLQWQMLLLEEGTLGGAQGHSSPCSLPRASIPCEICGYLVIVTYNPRFTRSSRKLFSSFCYCGRGNHGPRQWCCALLGPDGHWMEWHPRVQVSAHSLPKPDWSNPSFHCQGSGPWPDRLT